MATIANGKTNAKAAMMIDLVLTKSLRLDYS